MRTIPLLLFASVAFGQGHHRTENRALLGVVTVEREKAVVVAHVLAKSPAAKAKLEPGDVLLAIGGKELARTEDVDAALASAEPGATVEISYRRGDKKAAAKAKLIERRRYRGDFLKSPGRGRTGFKAADWFLYAWANVAEGAEPPSRKNTKGKVVVFHCFQSW